MPFMTGTLPFDLGVKVREHEKNVIDTLGKCRDALNGSGADAICTRWFGDNSTPFKKTMKEKIAKMRSTLISKDIECKLKTDNPNNNASATHYPGGIFGTAKENRVDDMRDTTNIFITIGANFKNLPATAAGAASGWTGQDKFETLVHELSHFVHGTADETMTDGSTAYGGSNARLLVSQDVAKAKNNAENWGFFVEEFR